MLTIWSFMSKLDIHDQMKACNTSNENKKIRKNKINYENAKKYFEFYF